MGRDKKNPKPLDTAAFNTLVKTAGRCCAGTSRAHARLHRSLSSRTPAGRVERDLDIAPDEDDAAAVLTATDAGRLRPRAGSRRGGIQAQRRECRRLGRERVCEAPDAFLDGWYELRNGLRTVAVTDDALAEL